MQLVYLLATAAAFDVWEWLHDCGNDGWGERNRWDEPAMHSTWPCTPVKTRPWWHGMKLVSDAAYPCPLLDDQPGGGGGWLPSLLQLHWGDWTAVRCDRCLLLQPSLAGGEAEYDISLYQLTSLCTVCRQAAQTLTVCTLFSIIIWVFPYPHIGNRNSVH